MANRLAGKSGLITGASRGLGRRLAAAFWAEGATLMLVSRSGAALQEVVASLPERPGQRAFVHEGDLADPRAVEAIVAAARRDLGALDVLVNNAAVQGPIGPAWQNPWEGWAATLQVNLLSPVRLCQLCVPWLAERGRGKIVNLSGGGATAARPRFSAYATAKTGLIRFSETLAEEARSLGIDVNCVAPGVMRTALLQEVLDSGDAAGPRESAIASKAFAGEADSSASAAELCVFLASAESDGITGKLVSAVWDPWEALPAHRGDLERTDVYTLRRVVPRDRGLDWGDRGR